MAMKISILCFVTLAVLIDAQTSSTPTNGLPLPEIEETLTQALAEAERILTENILTHPEITLTYHDVPTIPLENMTIEVDTIATVNLTNLQIASSPFKMTAVTPHLKLMNLGLNANITLIEVTGNYTVSVEILNHTSKVYVISDRGYINVSFHNLQVSGSVGLDLNGNYLHVHTVDLQYRPHIVALEVHYIDEDGSIRTTEEVNNHTQGLVAEPIYADLTRRLNHQIKQELNEVLSNVTIPELMGNNEETEITFKTRTNDQIENVNQFIDVVLNNTLESLPDEIRIPDLEKSFERKIAFVTVTGNFKAERGWFRGLKTLHRTSPIILKHVNNSVEITAALGLSSLKFGYDEYSAKFLKVGPSGELTATVGKNSVLFRGTMSYNGGNCTVILDELKVRELDNIDINLTGLSPFNWILSKIATFIVNRSKQNIITAFEDTVAERIRTKLQNFDCRNYIPS